MTVPKLTDTERKAIDSALKGKNRQDAIIALNKVPAELKPLLYAYWCDPKALFHW